MSFQILRNWPKRHRHLWELEKILNYCNVKMIGAIQFNDNASIIFFNTDFYILRWNQLDTQLPPIMPGKFCYTCSCSTDDWNNFSLKKVQKISKQIFFLWSCFVPSKHHTSEVMNDETWNLPSLILIPKKNLWITNIGSIVVSFHTGIMYISLLDY